MCVYILCIHIYTPFSPPWICFLLFHCNPCYSPPITSIAKDFPPKSRQVLENLSQLRGWSSGPVLVCIKVSFFGLPRWFNGKEFTFDAGDARDVGWISALGRSPGVRKSSPLQYSCLGNSMDRRARQVTVHQIAQSDRTEHTLKASFFICRMCVTHTQGHQEVRWTG